MEYKVINLAVEGASTFLHSPAALEALLNTEGADNWQLVAVTSTDLAIFMKQSLV